MGVRKKCNTGFLNVITKCEIILLKKPGLGYTKPLHEFDHIVCIRLSWKILPENEAYGK